MSTEADLHVLELGSHAPMPNKVVGGGDDLPRGGGV